MPGKRHADENGDHACLVGHLSTLDRRVEQQHPDDGSDQTKHTTESTTDKHRSRDEGGEHADEIDRLRSPSVDPPSGNGCTEHTRRADTSVVVLTRDLPWNRFDWFQKVRRSNTACPDTARRRVNRAAAQPVPVPGLTPAGHLRWHSDDPVVATLSLPATHSTLRHKQ